MKTIVQKLRVIFLGGILIIAVLMMISFQNKKTDQKSEKLSDGKGIVVLELFTSQGCSSCPPADALLAEYADIHDDNIISLSFHVDYWNRLGWTDPFSKNMYSERQQWYSRHLPKGSVYTPQMIVNGNGEAVGNNRKVVSSLVQNELKVKKIENISVADISIDKNKVSFRYKSTDTKDDEILNIALVQKQATTHIKAGENKGVTITNHNIVRSFTTQVLSHEGVGSITPPAMFKYSEYALVLYVQNKNNLFISAATIKDLE